MHKRALNFYESICHLPDTSVEKRLAQRQLCVKSFEIRSWFIAVKRLHLMGYLILMNFSVTSPLRSPGSR